MNSRHVRGTRPYFFYTDPATTEIYTLSLHDALPISPNGSASSSSRISSRASSGTGSRTRRDRKSTRLNSSHPSISYAVFCLKKKKQQISCSPLQLQRRSDYQVSARLLGCRQYRCQGD